jgi:uncharacterized protein
LVQKPSVSPLERLFKLQLLLEEVRTKSERRTRTPEHLVHVEAAFQDAVRRRDEAAARLAQAESRKRALEEELAALSEQLKKTHLKKNAIKGTREYGAFLEEVDTAQREIRGREDELLSVEEALATAKAEVDAADAGFPAEEADYNERMGTWRDEQARLGNEIAKAEAAASDLRAGLDKRLLALFDRIAKVRGGVAVARVAMVGNQTAACSACNLRLRPQLLSDLRLSKEMITCESCKRILFWEGTAAG